MDLDLICENLIPKSVIFYVLHHIVADAVSVAASGPPTIYLRPGKIITIRKQEEAPGNINSFRLFQHKRVQVGQ